MSVFSTAETVWFKEHKFAINDHGDEATMRPLVARPSQKEAPAPDNRGE
jgi:hypothetical protein